MKNSDQLDNKNNDQNTQDQVGKKNKDKDSDKKNKLTEEENSNINSQKTSSKDQNTQDQVKKINKDKDSDKKNKLTEEENSNIDSQKTSSKDQNTQDQVEKMIDTEIIPNQEESIFAKMCSNTSKKKTSNEKTLGGNLNNYFDSNEIKNELINIGVPVNKCGSVTKKLKEYSERHIEGKIDLDKLKAKFHSYFEEVKSINKDNISKNDQIRIGIDTIKNKILSRIATEEGNQTIMTFGENSPRENDDLDNENKSFIDIPYLDLSAINNPDSEGNPFSSNSQNINKNENEKVYKMEEEDLTTNTNTTKLLDEFAEKISGCDTNRLKIQTYFKIYENKLGYNISPATEKLIIDLVLETEKYIESVKQIVKDYQMSEGTKARILEAIDNSTSKKSLEENIGKFEEGKEILKLMPNEKQTEDEGVYSKMTSKANKVYNAIYNKYYGYTNLSEQQIDEIAEVTKKISNTPLELDDIKGFEEYVETKGYTVENNTNSAFYKIYQSLQMQPQEEENVIIDELNTHHNTYCYAIGAVAAILLAMQFMNSYDNEVLYHGFGPSGY